MSVHFDSVTVRVPLGDGGTRTLLDDLSLELTEPRIAIIGANGSGKSTLLRLINGLIPATSGRVTTCGLDVATRPRDVRRRVGFIFTDPLAQLVMSTPLEDIELGLRRTIRDRTQRRARAMALLADHGLADLAHQSVHDLSGGERQLVALTSVLAIEPDLLIADEPTTLLDLRNRNRLHRTLTALPQQLIVSTHDLELAAACDRVLVVDAGRIIVDGPPAETIRSYRKAMA